MLPGERRVVAEELVRHGLTAGTRVRDGVSDIGRVPVDDGHDH
jgi:hypothetical protein